MSKPVSQETISLKCQGISMRPAINSGDEISLIRITAEGIRFGDIIACQINDGLMTHRFLVRKKISGKPFIITKGDNCSNADEAVEPAAVWGKVVEIRCNGKITNLQKPSWKIISFVTALFSCLEWKIYQIIAGKHGISPSVKKNIKIMIQGPKEFLFRVLVFLIGGNLK